MATFQKRGQKWRAIIRKRGYPVQSKTFSTKARAQKWARSVEDMIEDGEAGGQRKLAQVTLGELLDRHLVHLQSISDRGRKIDTADRNIRKNLDPDILLSELSYRMLEQFCRNRSNVDGVKKSTIKGDIMHISGAITTGTVEEIIPVEMKATMASWRVGLQRAGLIGNAESRDRRPTADEIDTIMVHTKHNKALRHIKYEPLVRFAIESCMRLDEICSLRWEDYDAKAGTIIIRMRKHPTDKKDCIVPLMGEAQDIIENQPRKGDCIFPYGSDSVSNGFRRICVGLGIDNLHFHDLRHEGISRLFERGYQIQEVAMVSGHRDWKSLKRYVNLRPADLAARERTQLLP